MAHRWLVRTGGAHPRVFFDYFFMGSAVDDKVATALAIIDEETEFPVATFCVEKGPTEHVVLIVLATLDEFGYVVVILRGDQEPSIIALLREVKKRRTERTLIEHAPRYSHVSQGLFAGGIAVIHGQTRVFVLHVEEKYGVRITAEHPILKWLIRHAAWTIARYAIRADGKASFERMMLKLYCGNVAEVTECVWWRDPTHSQA